MSGAEIPLLIMAVGGTGTQVYGQIAGASAQASAAERSAALKRQQAKELLSREAENEVVIRENGGKLENQFATAYAATGAGGGGLGGILEIHRQTERNILQGKRDAEFKAYMLNQGADIESQLASDTMAASYISGAGTILGLGAKAYGIYGKYSGNEQLPKVTT
jgi:hypothetical protein